MVLIGEIPNRVGNDCFSEVVEWGVCLVWNSRFGGANLQFQTFLCKFVPLDEKDSFIYYAAVCGCDGECGVC